jgi:hypothetical protein
MPALRSFMARAYVPWAAVRACSLHHLEVPASRRRRGRFLVPRPAVRAQHLQLFELSAPRRCLTKVFSTRQATLPLHALHRAYTSKLYGCILIKLLKPKPVSATASRIARLTAGSRARSAGSS